MRNDLWDLVTRVWQKGFGVVLNVCDPVRRLRYLRDAHVLYRRGS